MRYGGVMLSVQHQIHRGPDRLAGAHRWASSPRSMPRSAAPKTPTSQMLHLQRLGPAKRIPFWGV
jgi:hypothetical protein